MGVNIKVTRAEKWPHAGMCPLGNSIILYICLAPVVCVKYLAFAVHVSFRHSFLFVSTGASVVCKHLSPKCVDTVFHLPVSWISCAVVQD